MPGGVAANDSYLDAAAVRVAMRSFTRRTEEITRRHGLTPQRYTLLLLLKVAQDEGVFASVTSLVGSLQTTQSSVTQLVAGAVREGLVNRRDDDRDARRHSLHLTDEGSSRLDRAFHELGPPRAQLARVVASHWRR